jgi:hypothetical protein
MTNNIRKRLLESSSVHLQYIVEFNKGFLLLIEIFGQAINFISYNEFHAVDDIVQDEFEKTEVG